MSGSRQTFKTCCINNMKDNCPMIVGAVRFIRRLLSVPRALYLALHEKHQMSVVQKRLDKKVAEIAKRKGTVKVGFLVIFDSVFQFEKLFSLMQSSKNFIPKILIIPTINRPLKETERILSATYEFYKRKYGDDVILSMERGTYLDFKDEYDLFITMNSYDGMTHGFYRISYLSQAGKPVVTANYGYDGGTRYAESYTSMKHLGFLWRYYAGTKWLFDKLAKNQVLLSKYSRIKLSGVPKMDGLSDVQMRTRSRKKIIICPHHSIPGSSLITLSNFTRMHGLILKLPVMFPDIDWVFRPHPLLKQAMIDHAGWSERVWQEYISDFTSYSNAIYYPEGDCFDLFVNSDAMIQDCSSFLAEYHCSGHPQCYVLNDESTVVSQFDEWGQELLSHTYKAFSEDDVVQFVNEVIVKGEDIGASKRLHFVKEKMQLNFPHVNEVIFNDLKIAFNRLDS